MRFANGLAILQRTNSRKSWNLASFHSPHSVTWSWILSFDLPKRGKGPWFYLGRWRKPRFEWTLFFFRFRLGWQTQEPMWYRDMYIRERDLKMQRDGMMWLNDNHPNKLREPPPMPPAPTAAGPNTLQ